MCTFWIDAADVSIMPWIRVVGIVAESVVIRGDRFEVSVGLIRLLSLSNLTGVPAVSQLLMLERGGDCTALQEGRVFC
jgi:hypothetical protein